MITVRMVSEGGFFWSAFWDWVLFFGFWDGRITLCDWDLLTLPILTNSTAIREAERKLHLQTYGPGADLCNLPISGQHDGKSKDDC
jgi:hypothetical protein